MFKILHLSFFENVKYLEERLTHSQGTIDVN